MSKSFGLIDRFSEDIDITVFRSNLGQDSSIEELETLSGKKRRARLDAIKEACSLFINGVFLERFTDALGATMTEVGIPVERYRVEADGDDPDRQTLLFWYPAVTAATGDYIRSAVKIEAGAKSALDPNVPTTVKPFVADALPELDLRVIDITTVQPERTFWDKVMILHGLRTWHDRRGQLRHGGQRVSRHYYDVFRLQTNLQSFRTTVRSEHAWLTMTTTATSALTPGNTSPAQISTQGEFDSPRGCRGTFGSVGRAEATRIEADFTGTDCQ